MFAVFAVSTEVAAAATRPGVAAARRCVALADPDGDGLALGDEPAPAEGSADAGAEGPGDAVAWPGEVGEGDGEPAVGLAVGEGPGRQMMPRMHPWAASGAAMACRAPVALTRAAASTTGSVTTVSSRLTRPPPTRCPRRSRACGARPRRPRPPCCCPGRPRRSAP